MHGLASGVTSSIVFRTDIEVFLSLVRYLVVEVIDVRNGVGRQSWI